MNHKEGQYRKQGIRRTFLWNELYFKPPQYDIYFIGEYSVAAANRIMRNEEVNKCATKHISNDIHQTFM